MVVFGGNQEMKMAGVMEKDQRVKKNFLNVIGD